MGRTRARVLAWAFHPAVVWIGCALGACLTSGCAGPGHLSWSTGQGSPPASACQSNVAQQSKPKNGGSSTAARPAPHTVGQAWRAYLDRLHSPLSERGPAMNVEEGRGDTGLSRYPPAEGERNSQMRSHHERWRGKERHRCEHLSSRRGRAKRLRPRNQDQALAPSQPRRTARPARRAQRPRIGRAAGANASRTTAEPTGRSCLAGDDLPRCQMNMIMKISSIQIRLKATVLARRAEPKESPIARSSASAPPRPGRCWRRLGLDPSQTFGSGGESGDISQRQRDTGLSRYPPAEGERSFPSDGAQAQANGTLWKERSRLVSAHMRRRPS